MRTASTTLLALLPMIAGIADADELFDPSGGGPTPLLFLHPLVDYSFPTEWEAAWEHERMREGGVRLTVGSVSTKDFLTRVELNLREPLHRRLRLLYELDWEETLHVDRDRQRHLLGLEFAATKALGLQLQVHPAADKEELDLQAGLLWTDDDRARYVRLALRFDDLVYDEKNDRGGQTDTRPIAWVWAARWEAGPWEADCQGDWSNRRALRFADSAASPELAASERIERELRATARRRGALGLVELRYHQVSTASVRVRRGAPAADSVESDLHDLSLRSILELSTRFEFRGELHRLWQEAEGRGSSSYDYERDEWIPAAFLSWLPARWNRVEIGAMTTFYEFDALPDRDAESGTATKLKLGWFVRFDRAARLGLSLSHEPDPQRFGGGNIQFQVLF